MAILAFVWLIILVKILDFAGVKEKRRPGDRSAQLGAQRSLKRYGFKFKI